MIRRYSAIGIIYFVILWTPSSLYASNPDDAAQFIESLSKKALTLLQQEGSLKSRESRFQALLSESFDLPLISRYVLGPSWKRASSGQKQQYRALFQEFVVRTYSRRLGGYTGQRFEIIGTKPIGKKDILVSTKISQPSGPAILAGWRVRYNKNGYKILDVMVSGVSMLVTQRSEFRAVVRNQGIGGLIRILRAQVSKFSASGG